MRNKLFVFAVLFLFMAGLCQAQDNNEEAEAESPPQEEIIEDGIFPQPEDSAQEEMKPQPISAVEISQPASSGPNKISLDIKGMDIVDVLKMLASRSGLNIVVGKNVAGRVTLFLKDVDIKDAFEIILLANDLAYETKGDIINVMTQRDYELLYGQRYLDKKQARIIKLKYAKAVDLSRALNQIKSNIGRIVVDEGSNTLALIDAPDNIAAMERFILDTDLPVQTKIFSLNYAQADKLQPKLQEIITKGVGTLSVDERTNKVIVTDYPGKLEMISKIITSFDEKTPQVLIDAQIVELSPSDEFEMGVDWDYWIKNHFRVTVPLAAGSAIGFGTAVTPASVGDFSAILDMLRTIGDTKILSSPRIIALNNQEARILVGTKDAYITSSSSQAGDSTVTSQTVNFVDVGIKLYVTPTVNRDGFVTMKIRPEISSAERTNIVAQNLTTQIPIVTTSEAETTVMLKDGVTIIIGGLKRDSRIKTVRKIPVLGDIPLLGFFFRDTSDSVETTELVILLTPHIITGENSFTDFSEIKPKEGAVLRMDRGKIISEKVNSVREQEVSKQINYEYYRVVADKLKSLSISRMKTEEKGEVMVSFVLNPSGQLKGEPWVLSSSNEKLNTAAIECVKRASPFPPFPSGLEKEEEAFRVNLSYE